MPNILTIKPGHVTIDQLRQLLLGEVVFHLDPSCQTAIDEGALIIQKAAQGNKAVYGVNTGFGKLANTQIPADKTSILQRNLILSHCCGVGDPLDKNLVRTILSLKLLSLGHGASGVRWEVIQYIQTFLEHDILPLIPAQGSVGASGDLAPLAHMTAAFMGEGTVHYREATYPAAEILSLIGLPPLELGPKEGLALINGTQASTAFALSGLFKAWDLARSALITGALSTDAMMGTAAPFSPKIHELRGHKGQIEAARTLRLLMEDSEIRHSHQSGDNRVQDPYSLRCQPQVMGAIFDQLNFAAKTLRIEANAVTDNPLILDEDHIISGGNFHAEPVALTADQIALCLAETGAISQRRIAIIVDPTLNYKLPAFLSPDAGLNSGFMIAEVTSAALMSENKHLASPCSVDSTPTSANQEDHVSMAAHGGYRLQKMSQNLAYIIGIELLTASQGVNFRAPAQTSSELQKALELLRKHVPQLKEDRFLAPDLEISKKLIAEGTLLKAFPETVFPQMEAL